MQQDNIYPKGTRPKPLTHNSIMPFGFDKGKKMKDVSPKFLLTLFKKGCGNALVYKYVEENLEYLKSKLINDTNKYVREAKELLKLETDSLSRKRKD